MQAAPINIAIIAASTGGPKVLLEIFGNLPRLRAAIIIVQHIPTTFHAGLAEHLGDASAMTAQVAGNSQTLEQGHVYVAPGGRHLELHLNKSLRLTHTEKVNFVCPSADVTMNSLAPDGRGKHLGIVLTGMGRDGAHGIIHMKRLGATTIAQDPATAAVPSMPREAIECGAVDFILTPSEIRDKLILFFR